MTHAYDPKDGSPRHYVDDGKGGTRDTTLRDIRKNEWVCSVTGILGIVASPGLTNYFISQHLEAAWLTDADEYNGDYANWSKDVKEIAGEHSKQARDNGTAVHNAIEMYYKEESGAGFEDDYLDACVGAVKTALSNVYDLEVGNCTPEVSFATESYGGCADLVGDNLVIDIKTKAKMWKVKKDGTPTKDLFYKSYVRQLAAYRVGLGMPNARCANIFVGPDAEVYIKEYTEEELTNGYKAFMNALELWQDENDWEGK